MVSSLTIKSDDGKISGSLETTRGDNEPTTTELLNPVMDGNKIVFDVTSQFRDREFTSTYAGVVTDRGIDGWMMMSFGGQNRDNRWNAQRK